jgi:hypothetical protein
MTCNEVRERCQRYLDGELSCSESCCFSAHVDRCAPCRSVLEEQRAYHLTLQRASSDCVHSAVPTCLAARAFARIDQACAVEKCPVLSRPWIRRSMLLASLFVFSALSYLAWCQLYGNCRWVVAASEAHDSIVDGRARVFASSADAAQITRILAEHGTTANAPSLERCKLKPHHCGGIQVAGCTGVYVCYQQEGSSISGTDATLFILPTDATPRGEKVRESLTASSFKDHSILSWHTQDKRYLCLLVTREPLEKTLPLAEAAKSELATLTNQ